MEFRDALKEVAGTLAGRRVLFEVLRACYVDNVFEPRGFDTNKMVWLEGRRSVGMSLLGEIRDLENGLDLEVLMRKECLALPPEREGDDVYDKTVD